MKRLQILLPFVGVAVLLAVWSLTVWARIVDPVLLPSPVTTFRAMWIGMTSGKLGVDFLKTVERTIYSTAIAAVIAIPFGILLGSSEKVYRSVEFLIDFFRSTPASAMFPLFLVLFGVGDRTKISVAAFGAALVIVVVAEMFIGSTDGLGQSVFEAQQLFNMPDMYAAIFAAGALGYGLNLLFLTIERRFVHWSGK